MASHPLILDLAKRIQWIEHGGRHTWDSCDQSARDRAIEQAKACFDEINLGALADAFEALPSDIASDPGFEPISDWMHKTISRLEATMTAQESLVQQHPEHQYITCAYQQRRMSAAALAKADGETNARH